MKLPAWMTRRVAATLLLLGVILVAVAFWAYGTEVVGSWCNNGEPSDSTGSGTCSYNDGVDSSRGDRTVDTILGLRLFSWIGVTKWPALLIGSLGAITGLLGIGASSALAFLPTRKDPKLDSTSDSRAERPDLFAGDYLEFTVQIEGKPKGYAVEVSTPTGQTLRALHNEALPQDRGGEQLEALVTAASKRLFGDRRAKAVAAFGTQLFDAIFIDATEKAFRDSIDFVRKNNATLRVVLQVDNEFADIPWEYLYDPERGSFLARSRDTSLVRLIQVGHATRSQSDIDCLRILSMAASPRQTTPLDIPAEQQHIRSALAPSIEQGRVQLEFVDGGSLAKLNEALTTFRPHVFHFAGHGDWDVERDDGVILFEDSAGFPQPVTGLDLGTVLNRSELRLAIFNSCHAATPSKHDRFAGITSSLVAQGVPAAVGMQFNFDDKAAVTFGSTLLRELGAGAPLDLAVTDARIAVFSLPNPVEWGTPVLTTRIPLGQVLPRSYDGVTYARS